MRTLKFRVWSESDRCYRPDLNKLLTYGKSVVYSDEGDRFDIEQFTGLLDRNGKEIYEGDRIKIEGSDAVYTVEYGRGVWVARFGDEPGDNICLFHYVQKDMVLYAEVVGNVHENKELLGDKG